MRRRMSIAAFTLFLAVPLWAQHGGGHGGFGGHSFGGHAVGGRHAFGGAHVTGGRSFAPSSAHTFSSRPGSSSGKRFSRGPIITNGFRGRFHTGRFRNRCFGFPCRGFGFPWWGAYYDPWWDWSYDDQRFDDDYNNNLALAERMDEQSLEQQRLLHQEEAEGDRDAYAPRAQRNDPAPNIAEKQGSPVLPPTVLVYRDQHQQEIQNYAIVGQTLWSFNAGHTQKISLSALDLAATEKVNDDRGMTFRVPSSGEGQ